MKKIFSFALVLVVLVAALGFSVGSANAWSPSPSNPTPKIPAPKVFFSSPIFNDLGVGERVPAETFEGKKVYCVVKDANLVRCEFPKSWAGKTVNLSFNVDGNGYYFYNVYVPKLKEALLPG